MAFVSRISTLVLALSAAAFGTQIPLQLEPMSSSPKGPLLSPDFEAFVKELTSASSIPGVSVGAIRLAGEHQKPKSYVASWGRKTEDGEDNDLTPDTLFGLGSCSKAFLATSVGLLIDDFAHGRNVTPLPAGTARLDWDTKIAAILPDQWLLDDVWATRAASIKDVLAHVSGMARHDASYSPGDSPEDVVLRMTHLRTAYELREQWSYNNQMYVLGAYIIEKYANTSYPAFVTERLFKPLNMTSTTFVSSAAESSGRLTQTWTHRGRRIPYWLPHEEVGFLAGAGGVISSTEDMVNWLAVLLNKGVDIVSGDTIIPRSAYDAVTIAHYLQSGSPTPKFGAGVLGYGLGWSRWTYGGIEMISHNGGFPGGSTLTAFSPSSNLGVVILINANDQDDHAHAILKRAFDDVLHRTSNPAPLAEISTKAPPPDVAAVTSEPLSLDLSAYTGTYSAPGYGSVTLCSPESTSHYCAAVLADFSSLGPVAGAGPARLYAAYNTVWSSHVRLRHTTRDTFEAAFTSLFPRGYGKNTTAFEMFEEGVAERRVEFVVDGTKVDGFALIDDEKAVAARVRRTGGSVAETSDAWFAKV